MKTTLLASLSCLKKLVNNKVVVVNVTNNKYTTYSFSRYCDVPKQEDFNLEDYALLESDKYSCIIKASNKMKEQWLVNKLWDEQNADSKMNDLIKAFNTPNPEYRIGDKVHLHDKDGIYTVESVNGDIINLTCSIWKYTSSPVRSYHKACIKCFAGGVNNFRLGNFIIKEKD
jgi:hypothetical protein